MNGPNEKAMNTQSPGSTCGGIQNELPAIDPPGPVLGRIEHDQRPPARAGRLVHANVLLAWKSQIVCEPTRAGGQEFFLEGERELGQFVERVQRTVGVGQRCGGNLRQLLGIERILRQNRLEQLVEPAELVRSEMLGIQSLQSAPLVESR